MNLATTGAVDTAAPLPEPPAEAGGARRALGTFGSWLRRPSVQTALAGLSGVLLTIAVMVPPMYADSDLVWTAALTWPDIPTTFPAIHHAMRLGTVLPVRLSQEILGPNQIAWIAASALFAAIFTAGFFALGRALFRSSLIGTLAVALILIHPFFTVVDAFTRATTNGTGGLLPDMPAAGWYSLGVAALVIAARRADRRQTWWLVTAGLCMGLAYLTREYVAFMFVALPIFFVLLRMPMRRIVVMAFPMLGVLGFELVHNAIVYGDALARLKIAEEHEAPQGGRLPLSRILFGFLDGTANHTLGTLLVIALTATVAGAVIFRDRRLILLVVWFLTLWVPFTILGGLLDPVQPSLKLHIERYWFLVYPPIIVGALATLKLTIERVDRTGRRLVILAVTAVALGAYVAPALAELPKVHRDQDWRELRAWFAQHPEVGVIHTDDRTYKMIDFYTMTMTGRQVWDGEVRRFRHHTPVLPVDEIGRDPYLETLYGARERPDTADGWRILFRSENGVLTIWQRSPANGGGPPIERTTRGRP